MSSDSFSYLSPRSRNILPHGKVLVLFLLAFLMLLPAAFPAPAKSSGPTQIVSQTTSAVSPNVTPDFAISSNLASITTTSGSTRTLQITLTSIGGFMGQVYMSPSSFSFPSFPVDLNPPIVSLSSGTASSTLTITVPSNASPGPNTVFIDSTGGCTLFHFIEISVNVVGPDFTVTSEKTQMTLAPGGTDTAKIDLASLNGFSGTISLDSFSPFTTSINPSSVTLAPGGSGSSTATVTAPIILDPGNYTVSIEGSLFSSTGLLIHSADIQVTVTGQAIVLGATKHFLTLIAGGDSNSSTITVTATGGFTGQVSLVASPPTPLSPSLSVTTVTVPPVGTSVLTVSAPPGTKAQRYFIDVNGSGTSSPVRSSTVVIVQVKQPDFEISADPFFMAVVAGGLDSACMSTVSVTRVLGFAGNVGLALKGSPNVVATLNPTSVTVPGTSTLTVSAPPGAVPGFYTLEVNGTSLSPARTHSAFAEILVIGPDFTLSADPDPLTVMAGSSGTSTISLTPILGFSSAVSLTALSSDPELTPTLSSPSVSSSSPSTLTVAVTAGTVPGDFYSVQVNGTSGQLTHSVYLAVRVTGPGFYITANPSPITVNEGTSATSTITITPTNGFSSSVDLFASPNSQNLNASIQPTTVTSGSYVATLSVNSTIPGSYSVDINGFGTTSTGGFLSNITTIQVTVVGPDFFIAPSPPSLTITPGDSKISTIIIETTNGFNSPIDLLASAPTGLTATFVPATITPPATTSTLTVAVDPNLAPGTYTVDIQAAGGKVSRTTRLIVNVVGFTLAASPDTVTIAQGTSNPSTITVTPLNGFTGTVQLSASLPTGLSGTPSPTSITGGSGTSQLSIAAATSVAPGTYLVNVTGTSGSFSQKATITVTVPVPNFSISAGRISPALPLAGSSATFSITVAPTGGFSGAVSFQVSPSTPSGLTCTTPGIIYGQGQSPVSCSATVAGNYTITVTGTATIGGSPVLHTTGSFVIPFFDYTVSASAVSPSSILPGNTATSTITVNYLNIWSPTVTFTVSASSPSGLNCLTPSLVSGGGTQTSTLSCSASVPGDYTVTVTGAHSSLSHSTANILFHVVGFAVSASSPAAANTGQTVTSTITLTAVNGFTGTVSLSDTPLPNGLTCTAISQTTVTVTYSPATATLSCNSTQDGTFTVTITGTSSSLAPQATASFTFHTPDIMITSTTPPTATSSQSTTSTITISPVYGFTGTVTLSVTAPSGMACTLDHTTLRASGTATLTCTSSTPNDYTVIVTATGGAAPHTTTETFHVSAAPSPVAPAPTIFGLTPLIFYGIIGVIIVAVIAGITVAVRRKNP